MNILLDKNSIRSELLKRRYRDTDINMDINQLLSYLTVLIFLATLNIKMDSNLCLYSLCYDSGPVYNIEFIIQFIYEKNIIHKILNMRANHQKNIYKYGLEKNKQLYISKYQDYESDDDQSDDDSVYEEYDYYNDNMNNLLKINRAEQDNEDDENDEYSEDDEYSDEIINKNRLSFALDTLNINDYYLDILNKIDEGMGSCKTNFLYTYVLPKNIVELEIINKGKYKPYIEKNLDKNEIKTFSRLSQKRYFEMQNSDLWLRKSEWPKIGCACETCDISDYQESINLSVIPKDIRKNFQSSYDPIYDRIDRCLWDKYQGQYTIKSNDGITYGEFAKAVKMVMLSKFLLPQYYGGITTLELIPLNLPNKYKLRIVVNFYKNLDYEVSEIKL